MAGVVFGTTLKDFLNLRFKGLQKAFTVWTFHREKHFGKSFEENDLASLHSLKLDVLHKVLI